MVIHLYDSSLVNNLGKHIVILYNNNVVLIFAVKWPCDDNINSMR